MHAHELVELAAHLALQHGTLVEGTVRLSTSGLEQFWTASKCRLDHWSRAIKKYQSQSEVAHEKLRCLLWHTLRPVLEEILMSETLTRVYTALVCLHDHRYELSAGEPVVRSVYIGHLEARNRTLHLLLRDSTLDPEEVVQLNKLRRRCENWTDMLLAWLGPAPELDQWAFHPERRQQFAEELLAERGANAAVTRGQLTLASLRASFTTARGSETSTQQLNAQLAAAILSCFPSAAFDSTGRFKGLWQARLENTARDTQGLLTELLDLGEPASTRPAPLRRF